MHENPEIFRELLNASNVNSLGQTIRRLDVYNIEDLFPLMKENSEIVKTLLNETVTRNGSVIGRFSVPEIIKYTSVIKKEPVFLKFLKQTTKVNGEIVPKYNAKALGYLSKNSQTYSMVKDEKVLSEIDNLIGAGNYKDADALIDTMNNIEGNYSTLFGTYTYSMKADQKLNGKIQDSYKFAKYLKSQGLSIEQLNKGEITEELAKIIERRQIDTTILAKDFEITNKYQRMAEYIKMNPNNEISDYLYEHYYLNDLEKLGIKPKVIERCKSLNKKYNVKIMPSCDGWQPLKTMDAVEAELEKWISASVGTAKLPPVIEFSTAKSNWYDKTAAYGKSASDGYSEGAYNGAISFARMRSRCVRQAMRHEMTHTNDLTRATHKIPEEYNMDEIMPHHIEEKSGHKVQINEPQKGKYYQEFKNAGLPDRDIDYAYNNTKEYIAVASEGDMSKYSQEFKRVLIDFGMPGWILNIV